MRALRSKKPSWLSSINFGTRLRGHETLERRDLFSSQGLDATFGNAGIVEQTFSAGSAFAQSVAVQSDGKLVVGGTVANVVGSNLVPSGFVLARYNADGTPDLSFASNGAVATNRSLDPFIGGANDILVESDGKLLVAGGDMARYNADGTLDTSFGLRGIAPGGGDGIGLQSDGKILENGTDLARYNPDGTPDTTFGTNGYIVLAATQFVVTPGDAIVTVSGNVLNRLTADGQVDTTFGDAGTTTLPLPNGDSFQPTSLVLTADGKIDCVGNLPPAGGFFRYSPYSIAVFQLNSDGTLNQGFGNNGEAILSSQEPVTEASGSVLLPDGKLVLVGRSGAFTSPFGPGNFVGTMFTAELDATGALDPTWGSGGTSRIAIGDSSEAGGVALTENGQIVIVGDSVPFGASPTSHALVVVRLDANFNEAFVQHAYLDLLDRPVDPAALTYFTTQLESGVVSCGQLVQILQASSEYSENIVRQDYVHLLQRPVDPLGLKAWAAFLESGGSRTEVESRIVSSDEYYNRIAAGDRDVFLNDVFQGLLNRPLDAASRAAYDEAFSSGAGRAAIVDYILNSPEFAITLVDSLYLQVLARPADAGGLATFLSQLAAGTTPDLVIAQMVASDENYSGS